MNWGRDYFLRAHEDLVERLMDGKTVNGLSLADLIDCDVDRRGRAAVSEIYILLASIVAFARDEHIHGERRARVHEYLEHIATRYINEHPDLVREHAAEMMEADAEEMR